MNAPDVATGLQVQFTPFPTLQTERLVLRKIEPADAPQLLFLRSDEKVMKFLDREPLRSLDEARFFINRITDSLLLNDGITWGICLKDDPSMIGTIGFWRLMKEHYRAEIGYMLHPDYWGKGYTSEAFEAAMDYGFHHMKLHSVEGNVNPENTASMRVLEKAGFVREAYFRENYYFKGRFLDSAIYSKLTPLK